MWCRMEVLLCTQVFLNVAIYCVIFLLDHAVSQHQSPPSGSSHQTSASSSDLLALSNSAVLLSRSLNPQDPRSRQDPLLTAYWGSNDTHFLLQLEGRTLGWMAFGMSPTGRMDMSDVMFGWCNDTPASLSGWEDVLARMPTASFHPAAASTLCYTQDRLIRVHREEERVDLLTDAIQDWRLISGRQNGTHTVLRAVRPFISSALQSTKYPITREVMAIFAIGMADPDVTTGEVQRCAYKGSRLLTLLPVDPHSNGASHSFPSSGYAEGGPSVHSGEHNGMTDSHSNSNENHGYGSGEGTTTFNTTLLQLIGKTLNGLGELLNGMSRPNSNSHS